MVDIYRLRRIGPLFCLRLLTSLSSISSWSLTRVCLPSFALICSALLCFALVFALLFPF